MDPLVAGLVDQLVEGDSAFVVERDDLVEQPLVIGRGSDRYVRRLAPEVLGGRDAAHRRVQFRAAVAAVHSDWVSPYRADRIQKLLDERLELLSLGRVGRVVDAAPASGVRRAEFFDAKIGHVKICFQSQLLLAKKRDFLCTSQRQVKALSGFFLSVPRLRLPVGAFRLIANSDLLLDAFHLQPM